MVSGQKAKRIEDEPAFQRMCALIDEMTLEERQRTEEIIKKRMIKTKHAILLLITTNVITLIVLLIISFHYNVPTNLLNELGLSAPSYSTSNYRYTNNKSYGIRRSLFRVYTPQKIKIVMLGDSITYEADWNELLSRTDVANRGVSGDITEGFINRLSDIYELTPEICMIMGGFNDIVRGIPVSDIFASITKIIEGLQANNITPIIQSTLFVSAKRQDWKELNERVSELNRMLKDYGKANDIVFIDVNKELSKNGALEPSYTYDGVHLLGNGYRKWKDLILSELQ